jgi:hypothetical protein
MAGAFGITAGERAGFDTLDLLQFEAGVGRPAGCRWVTTTNPSRRLAPKQTLLMTANRLGALGGELLVAVRFFVDFDQGGAAA